MFTMRDNTEGQKQKPLSNTIVGTSFFENLEKNIQFFSEKNE